MTREQFALAVAADEKWVENSARLLSHPLKYSQSEARWTGLVRLFNHEVGLPLKRSAELATEAVRHPESTRELRLGRGSSGAAGIVVDLARFYSAHNAALSAALTFGGARKRGRPLGGVSNSPTRVREQSAVDTAWDMLARAKAYGVDLAALRDGLNESPGERLQRLEDNAKFVAEMRNSTANATQKSRSDGNERAR